MKCIIFSLLFFMIILGFWKSAIGDEVRVTKLNDHLYKFTALFPDDPNIAPTNVVASIGKDGILLIDTGRNRTGEKLAAELKLIDERNVKVIINTHLHPDHFGGNTLLGKNATIIVHENTRGTLLGEYFGLKGLSIQNSPILTFRDELSLRFNGENIKLIYLPGHTNSDIIVHFPDSKILCTGDLIISDMFGNVNLPVGGDVHDYINTMGILVNEFPADTKFINGHGRDYTLDDVKNYYRMIVSTTRIIKKNMDAGKTTEEMISDNILKDWQQWSHPRRTTQDWIHEIYDSLLGENKKSISEPLSYTIMEKGIDEAIAQYYNLKSNQPDLYNFNEGELNMLGYQLIWRKMILEAIEIFKLNVQAFPKSFNCYDSLGEAYMINGDAVLAIKNYEISLELNPENINAIEMLKKLKGESDESKL